MSRLRSSENSIQRSVEESKQQFRKEKKHLSEVINALVRSKQELQLKYDVVLKKLSLQNISSKKKILTNNINNSPVTTTPIRSNNSNYNKKNTRLVPITIAIGVCLGLLLQIRRS